MKRHDAKRIGSGLLAHVQPVFLLPAGAIAVFGAVLADYVSVGTAIAHCFAVCLAVYVAHLRDGYVDYYVRNEDDQNRLTPTEIHVAIVLSTAAFGGCLAYLWLVSGTLSVVLSTPILALGLLHAPYLDTNPVTTTVSYPLGIALAMAGGYATQTGTLTTVVIVLAGVFFVHLAGIGILLDRLDYHDDRRRGKRTVPVVVGDERAEVAAWMFVLAGSGLLLLSSVVEIVPQSSQYAALIPISAVAIRASRRIDRTHAVVLSIGTMYLFAAVLFFLVRPSEAPTVIVFQ
ncbi:UbiA family prenyltransferase [Natrarchaeobius sp. A-rgal3]|uniref:UbiA family prenyltransferase n=1 Tax=Natrarchaeobius versutus TaxID=1679078 RepID=UPI00350FA704